MNLPSFHFNAFIDLLLPLPIHTHACSSTLIVVSLNVFSVVGLYRLFGSCRVIVAYYSEAFTKSTHPSTECVYWLTDAYHLQTLCTSCLQLLCLLIFTDMIERFSFCSEIIV